MHHHAPSLKPRIWQSCVCCGHSEPADARFRHPLCGACAVVGSYRSYCTGCGAREEYAAEAFVALIRSHIPDADCAPGTVIQLPACAACRPDSRLPEGTKVIFHQIIQN